MSSCREDTLLGETETPIPTDLPEYYETNLNGRVLDVEGRAVAETTVIIGQESTVTDIYGFYEIKDVLVPESGIYIKATKEGYFVGGTQYIPPADLQADNSYAFITMVEYGMQQSFPSSTGVDFMLADGSALKIPADGFSRDGESYEGEVIVNMIWLDPTAEQTSYTMPGALIGRDINDELQLLQTYGMLGVEMSDGSGNVIQLADGMSATLTFPIPDEILSTAPQEIPLWHFDEVVGEWQEEGSAIKEGNQYTGMVSHFSWWNCDLPGEYTYLCLDFFDENGNNLLFADYCITAEGWGTVSGSLYYTNTVCELAPANVGIKVGLKDNCGAVYYEQDLGSFPEGASEADVMQTIAATNERMTIYGDFTDCKGDPVTKGMVSVETDFGIFTDYLVDDGSYSINFAVCDLSANEVIVNGIDLNEYTQSNPIELTLDYSTDSFEQHVDACEVELTTNMVIAFESGQVVTLDSCTARVTSKEVLVLGKNTNSDEGYIFGVQGFETGTHTSNFISPGLIINGELEFLEVELVEYGAVGEKISGTFTHDQVSGSFIADRIQ